MPVEASTSDDYSPSKEWLTHLKATCRGEMPARQQKAVYVQLMRQNVSRHLDILILLEY